MTWLAGVDGCPAGWFRACRETETGELRFDLLRDVRALTEADPRPALKTVEHIVEFVDIMPTLAVAAGIPDVPHCESIVNDHVKLCSDGFSSYESLGANASEPETDGMAMTIQDRGKGVRGFSLRTSRFRYNRWMIGDPEDPAKTAWRDFIADELYDHTVDPDENFNMIGDPLFGDVIAHFESILKSKISFL